jgi:hypothetical protein
VQLESAPAVAPARHPSSSIKSGCAAAERAAFLAALKRVAAERRRDGAYAWGIFANTARSDHLVETFFVDSWLEHLRQHQRVTNADRYAEEHLRKILCDAPKVTHYIAARPPPAVPLPQDTRPPAAP